MVRAKAEHVSQMLKLKFGFVKVYYRGLKENAHRLFVTCTLVNLFVSRKKIGPEAVTSVGSSRPK